MKLDLIEQHFSAPEILDGLFGLEREGLRVHPDGTLAKTPHPAIFGPKLENPYITTDFSESQVEVVTPPCESVGRAHAVLEGLVDIVNNEIRPQGELLWPGSMPCVAPEDIPVARYGEGAEAEEAHNYRLGLIKKYGGTKQLLTGIHFNFSFTDAFLEKLRKLSAPDMSAQDFKNAVYLKIVRNYLKMRWLIIYLTGCSASMHVSYDCFNKNLATLEGDDAYIMNSGPSLRNSPCGYKNLVDLFPSYDSVEDYVKDVRSFVDTGLLSQAKELYTQIRMKPKDPADVLGSLEKDGIQYVEIRTIDLNLFDKTGVNRSDLEFLQLFLIYCLLADEKQTDALDWQREALENENRTATQGLLADFTLKKDGRDILLRDWAGQIFEDLSELNEKLGLGRGAVIEEMRTRVQKPETTYAGAMGSLVRKDGFLPAHLKFAKAYSNDSRRFRYLLRGFENYELSTQILIKEALTRGVRLEELDPADNFIALTGNGKTSYVKQATKTEADNYASVLAMENKVVTKKILEKNGIRVPGGGEYASPEAFEAVVSAYAGRPVVIKPKSTNFGLGIFIFEHGGSEEDLLAAAKKAFSYDDTILVEDYLSGQEFRFLVIDGQTVAVLKRVAANVTGDGVHTIEQLIDIKNEHPFRGVGYTAPMKKIVIDEQTEIYLKNQGLSPRSVPKPEQTVFLRGNSNISTGGDSIDMTDEMPESFKRDAEKAAEAIGAAFCGVDMIIEDYKNPDSPRGIIELNFNPSTDMHAFPMHGKERRTGAYVLSTLGLIDDTIEDIHALEDRENRHTQDWK